MNAQVPDWDAHLNLTERSGLHDLNMTVGKVHISGLESAKLDDLTVTRHVGLRALIRSLT